MIKAFLGLICGILSFAGVAFAEDQYLFGDWQGKRKSLEDQGLTIEGVVTGEQVTVLGGGVKRDTKLLSNIDFTLTLDTEKAGLWSGGTTFLYFLGDYGGSPTEIVGDLQATSNIDAPDAFKLYEAWYEQQLFAGRLSLLAGLHDLNSEFNVLEYAGIFLNSSFGIEPDISQVGPSIFPTTSLVGRVRVQPTDQLYFQTAGYDGVPGDPTDSRGTHLILREKDGVFYVYEAGVVADEEQANSRYYKIALGGWYQTTDFEDFSGEVRDKNQGVYLIGETSLFYEQDNVQGLGLFGQLGGAAEDRNEIARYFGFGLNYLGLFPGRDEDIFGIALAHARHGDRFLDLNQDADRYEMTLELTYRAQILPWLAIQPDFQYVINPGTDPVLDNAAVFSTRVEVVL